MTTYKCEACDTHPETASAAVQHELTKHEGAQTCWPVTDSGPAPTNPTHTVWVSIGRNVDAEPIEHYAWQLFKAQVHAALLDSGASIITVVQGSSDWQGTTEETYLILATIPDHQLDQVRRWLANIAHEFCQEAIGFVGGPGTDTLIRP